jgi:hypothetical protein
MWITHARKDIKDTSRWTYNYAKIKAGFSTGPLSDTIPYQLFGGLHHPGSRLIAVGFLEGDPKWIRSGFFFLVDDYVHCNYYVDAYSDAITIN